LFLGGLLMVTACSSDHGLDRAFTEVDRALPPQLQRVDEESAEGYRGGRYEIRGEPLEVAAMVRSSLVAHAFTLHAGSGLPDPSVTGPPAADGPGPVNLGPPATTEPPAVDAIQIRGFRGENDVGIMRSLTFHPAGRPGWTRVILVAHVQS
jgi:hypothetical protein